MLNCEIKLIKTAKPLFGHCWAIYCHIGKDKSNTSHKKNLKINFLLMGTLSARKHSERSCVKINSN